MKDRKDPRRKDFKAHWRQIEEYSLVEIWALKKEIKNRIIENGKDTDRGK